MPSKTVGYRANQIANEIAARAHTVAEQVEQLREIGRQLALEAAELELRCGGVDQRPVTPASAPCPTCGGDHILEGVHLVRNA